MSFKPISDFEAEDARKKKINLANGASAFLSINYGSGAYIGGSLMVLLEKPSWVDVEYDTVTNVLRFRKSGKPTDHRVKHRTFRLPETVRHAMAKPTTPNKSTVRYHVEHMNDGWWYTTKPITVG